MANLTEALRKEYETLFAGMVINPTRVDDADAIIAKIVANKAVYESIMLKTGIPWQVIGVFHSLEAGMRFNRHLHNGDPLTARTTHVPKGRPKTGSPPFTFVESAIDALTNDGLANLPTWTLAETLFRLEKFNGMGYRHLKNPINTPYLWSFSNQFTKGKFKADGVFDPNAPSKQCGGAVLLGRMIEKKIFDFNSLPVPIDVVVSGVLRPQIEAYVLKGNSWIAPRQLAEFVKGLSVTAVTNNPFRITVEFSKTGQATKTHSFEGRMFDDDGHVDASELVRDFLGLKVEFDDTKQPGRLIIG